MGTGGRLFCRLGKRVGHIRIKDILLICWQDQLLRLALRSSFYRLHHGRARDTDVLLIPRPSLWNLPGRTVADLRHTGYHHL